MCKDTAFPSAETLCHVRPGLCTPLPASPERGFLSETACTGGCRNWHEEANLQAPYFIQCLHGSLR